MTQNSRSRSKTIKMSAQNDAGLNHPGFETHGEGHTKSKTGNQWPYKMGLGPTKNIKKFFFKNFITGVTIKPNQNKLNE